MSQQGRTPIMNFIGEAIGMALWCVEYAGPLSREDLITTDDMQAVVLEALVDARVLVPNCHCEGHLVNCSCDFPRNVATMEGRLLRVQLLVKWGRAFKNALLKQEGCYENANAARVAAAELVRHGGVDLPGGSVEDVVGANLHMFD